MKHSAEPSTGGGQKYLRPRSRASWGSSVSFGCGTSYFTCFESLCFDLSIIRNRNLVKLFRQVRD